MLPKFQVFSDGGSRGNPGPSGAGWLIKKEGKVIQKGRKFLGVQTNNYAEYSALLFAIHELRVLCSITEDSLCFQKEEVEFFLDSELIVKQLKGEYKVKNKGLKPLYEKAMRGLDDFEWSAIHILREKNTEADALANMAMDERF